LLKIDDKFPAVGLPKTTEEAVFTFVRYCANSGKALNVGVFKDGN